MKAVKVGKRGTIIVPAKLRKRYGIEDGTLVTAEARGDGVLIRPAVVLPVERYTPKRKAEFRLSSRLPEEEPWSIASSLSQQPVSSSICNGLVDMNLNAAPEQGQDFLFSHGFRPSGANRDITPHSSSSFERALIGSNPRC